MNVFNNRELASATIIIVFFALMMIKDSEVRRSLGCIARSMLQKTIIITLATLAVYTIFVVFLLERIDVWNVGQLKNTILWFVFVAFVQLLKTTKVSEPIEFLRESLNSQLKLIVLVEFLVAFHSYSFVEELILVSLLTFLSFCSAFAVKPKHLPVKKVVDVTIAILGLFLLIDSLLNIYSEPTKFFSIGTFRDFLVPMLLSVSLLPYIYCFYYFLAYERAFLKAKIYTKSKSLQRYAKINSFIAFRAQPKLIHQWMLYSCITEFESRETIKESIEQFKANQRETTV
ncbi:hypothetical protein [Vibrio fluminensis]|uniref:hypothetical protein n=1 Tax=Vibrio fluminensis TaxID=2783614 RepID=UPI001887DF71|nr:hypothetical protein [Vibrio fluminensis]